MIRSNGDILCFFAVIQKVVPKSICDYGLFLCRCGATSRGIGGYTVSNSIQLSGVDLYPDSTPEIYRVIYNQLMSADEVKDKSFDLGIMLRISECVSVVNDKYIENAISSCRWLVTDENSYEHCPAINKTESVVALNLVDEKYIIIKGREC